VDVRTRQWTGLALSCLTVVVLALGMLGPGVAVAAIPVSGALILVTWVVSRVPVPVPLIVTWGVTVVVTGVTVVVATYLALSSPGGVDEQFPWWMWGVVLSYAATATCGVWYSVRHVHAVRQVAPISA
jgi:hypothetical protein